MKDEILTCVQCNKQFTFTEGEGLFYESIGLQKPKRCPDCRKLRRARNEEEGKNGLQHQSQ